MRTRLLLMTGVMALGGNLALAQTSLTPPGMPRVPAQPGQGLPAEDRAFLARAAQLSAAEVQAGGLGAERAADPELRQLSREIAELHARLLQRLRQQAPAPGPTPSPAPAAPWDGEAGQLQARSGDGFDKAFLAWQLRMHETLVRAYQVQASNTPENELARLAIIGLADIQKQFAALRRIGARHGLEADLVEQPPQY